MRTDLNVPYAEKDKAKRLGARWDIARRVWFVVDVENLEPFLRWIPLHLKKPSLRNKTRRKKKEAPKLNQGMVCVGSMYYEHGCTCIPWEDCTCGEFQEVPLSEGDSNHLKSLMRDS